MPTSTNTIVLDLGIDEAFDLVSDPALYPRWLVGAQSIRQIDSAWPARGAKFEHRIGFGPFAIPGSTTVREIKAPGLLVLAAGMGALGEARVRFELELATGGTRVSIIEAPRKGVVSVASKLLTSVVQVAIWGRNRASLDELACIAAEVGRRPERSGAITEAGGEVVGADPSGTRRRSAYGPTPAG